MNSPCLARFGNSILLVLILTVVLPAIGLAQGTQADYDRSAALEQRTQNKVFRDRVQPHWFDGGQKFWYRVQTADRHEFVLVDAVAGKREPAFDHARLAAALLAAGIKNAAAERLPVDQLDFGVSPEAFDLRAAGKWWRCERADYSLKLTSHATDPGDAIHLQPVDRGPKASTHPAPRLSNVGRGRAPGG